MQLTPDERQSKIEEMVKAVGPAYLRIHAGSGDTVEMVDWLVNFATRVVDKIYPKTT